jgi:hypothetical protein
MGLWKPTYISEEYIVSIFRVEEQETSKSSKRNGLNLLFACAGSAFGLFVDHENAGDGTPKRQALYELRGISTQNTLLSKTIEREKLLTRA